MTMNTKTWIRAAAATVGAGALALGAPVLAIPATVGNAFYDAAIQHQADGISTGSWAAATGASHPVGAGHDLLFAESGGNFGTTTNFSSLRVYNSAGGGVTDYTFGGRGSGTNLDPFFASEGASPFNNALNDGFQTVWNVTPEGLSITQDVIVTGNTFNNSAVYHTVEILNTSTTTSRDIGWRNLYDWQVDDNSGTDDGPSNAVETTSAVNVATTTFEFSHVPTGDEFVRVAIDPGVSSYEPLLAIGFDPGYIPALPVSVPDEYAYVSWPGSFGTSFDYTANPGTNVTGDSAGLSWFGRSAGTAHTLAPGDSVRFTQILFAVTGGAPPPDGNAPVPGTLAVFSLGLVGLVGVARRRRR